MRIEEIYRKLHSKEGLDLCGHTIKIVPSSLGSNDLILEDESRYIVRGVDEYAIDFGEKTGTIFGSFDVFDDDLPGNSEFSFLYDLNEDKLYRFNNTFMLTNIGFDLPVGVFGSRLMTFDLEKKTWIPRIEIPIMHYCRTTSDGILYLSRPFSLKKVNEPKMIDKYFSLNVAPEIYQSKYLWGILRSYLSCETRSDEELESWVGLRIPEKNSISQIRKFLKRHVNIYQHNRIHAFEELMDILIGYGVKDEEDITSLLYCLISISFGIIKDGVFLGFPNKLFNTFFKRIMDEYGISHNGKMFSLNDNIDLINQLFEPYIYWTDERVSEQKIEAMELFEYRKTKSYLREFEGKIGRLCFDIETKKCNIKYAKIIQRGYICEDYLIKTMESIRDAKESSHYMYADIAYNILTKRYVVCYRSSPQITDEMILSEVSALRIKREHIDLKYEYDFISVYYSRSDIEGIVDIAASKTNKNSINDTNVYIGFANIVDKDNLSFHKFIVGDGVERDNIWDIVATETKDYMIGYSIQQKRHVIRSKIISLEMINALKKLFNINNWTWERNDTRWKR